MKKNTIYLIMGSFFSIFKFAKLHYKTKITQKSYINKDSRIELPNYFANLAEDIDSAFNKIKDRRQK